MERRNITESLASARTAALLTQEELAAKLNVTRSAVSQWETGASAPTGPARQLLALTFQIPLAVVDQWFTPQPEAMAS